MLVLQSYPTTGGRPWVYTCMQSVQQWAQHDGHHYRCLSDAEVLDCLPEGFHDKVGTRWPILTDYARLAYSERELRAHPDVLWLDADVPLHQPQRMIVPTEHQFCFGQELWVSPSGQVNRGIHNALCYFQRQNPFLSFYRYACERLIAQFQGAQLAPQFLGPKLLKHYDNLLQLPKSNAICMVSPAISDSIVNGSAPLQHLQADLPTAAGVNLCSSLIDNKKAEQVIAQLLSTS